MRLSQILPGYKTYAVMVGGAVYVLAQVLTDATTLGEAINQWLLLAGGMTIRAGIKHDAGS